jgi:ribosome-binding protein aMBF1 (putative translation factor)
MLGIQIAYTSRCAVPAVQTQVPEDPPAELSDLDREFADRLRVSRKRCGLSQEEVARRMQEAGHSTFRQQTVARVERYQRGVYLREMKAFVHAVGSTVEELLPESFMCTEDERETYSIYT